MASTVTMLFPRMAAAPPRRATLTPSWPAHKPPPPRRSDESLSDRLRGFRTCDSAFRPDGCFGGPNALLGGPALRLGGPVRLRRDPGAGFRRGTGRLTRAPLPQANAHAMVRRRAAAAGIATPIGCHTFRATGITAYLRNGGTLETAAAIANYVSTRTTQLYDRRRDEVSLAEMERIRV